MEEKIDAAPLEELVSTTLIINGGSFGERLKYELEQKNIKTVKTIESADCIKKKNILYKTLIHAAASALERKQHYTDYSLSIESVLKLDWKTLRIKIQQKAESIIQKEKERPLYSVTEENGRIYINGTLCKARHIVIIHSEKNEEISLNNVWVKLIERTTIPGRIFIKGSNKNAVEAASILSDLGSKVYLLTESKTLLEDYETNIQDAIKSVLLEKQVVLFFQASVISTQSIQQKVRITLKISTGAEQVLTEINYCLIEQEYKIFENSIEGCTVIKIVEPTQKQRHAEIAVLNKLYPEIFMKQSEYMPFIPIYIFTSPSAAAVGYTESEARSVFTDVRVVSPKFRGLFYAVCQNKIATHYKLIFARINVNHVQEEKLIGLHLFGPSSIDAVKGFAVAMHCGISPEEILKTIPIHPTSSEEIITE